MATLTGEQLKDSYQSLVTIGDSITSDPTSGVLENGKGNPIDSVTIYNDATGVSDSSTLNLSVLSNDANTNPRVSLVASKAGTNGGKLILNTLAGDVLTERMRIDSSGNVGINTQTPASGVSASETTLEIADANIPALALNDTGGSKYTIYSSGGHLSFYDVTNTTERVRIHSSGGITFNGDTATANALDDYEEGTWTPTLEGGTTAGTYTFSTNQSLYTKIGRQVTVTSRLIVDTASGGVGTAKFGGLPFTKLNNTIFTGSVVFANVDVNNSIINISPVSWTISASTEFTFSSTTDNASAVNLDIAGISTGDSIIFSFTYFV